MMKVKPTSRIGLASAIIVIALMVVAIFVVNAQAGPKEIRSKHVTVTNVNNIVVTVIDEKGVNYVFYDEDGEGYYIGQKLIIVLDKMGTEPYYDDVIVNVINE